MSAPRDLVERAESSGLPTDQPARWQASGALERLHTYFERRRAWAGTHNLSGPRALGDPWGPDLVDGMAAALISSPGQILVDVGSGSGIPGLIVACLQPDRPIVLVEPIAKRTAFLRSVAIRLELKAVRVERGRWPLDLPGVPPGAADLISRAVVDPAEWPQLARRGGPLVGGVIRMLAARRPPCTLNDFEHVTTLSYGLATDGDRRVERWSRRAPG